MNNTLFIGCAIAFSFSLAACSDNASQNAEEQTQTAMRATSTNGPKSTQSPMWEYVVNNAQRTADEYALNRNLNAVFSGRNIEIEFIKQHGGEFKGRHLLKIVNEYGGNISFAMLLPLFDENASSEQLDDEGELWQVVVAKYNGKEF